MNVMAFTLYVSAQHHHACFMKMMYIQNQELIIAYIYISRFPVE